LLSSARDDPIERRAVPDPLERDLQKYKDLLPTLNANEGKFVVIYKGELLGIFQTYSDALDAGYKTANLEPFLVKQISTSEYVAYFTRDVVAVCLT
jgi:hypothetical protein